MKYFGLLLAAIMVVTIFGGGSCERENAVTNQPEIGTTTPEQILEGLPTLKDGRFTIMPNRGCTRTPGYWKTHTIFDGKKYDATWALLPGGLGANTPFFGLGMTWYQVFWTSPAGGEAYYILAHHFMAAALNSRAGATMPAEVIAALQHAAILLNTYDGSPSPMSDVVGAVRDDFLSTKDILANFNEGLIGPGSCP